MLNAEAITENSFNITGRGIVVELRHGQQGLAKGTQLTSEKPGHKWIVRARLLFDHAIHEQKIFKIESTDYMLLSFDSIEKKQKSIREIKSREHQHIYYP